MDGMARLNAATRRALPASAFVFPKTRKYPIHDRAHARAALAYARRNGVYARVSAAVRARYPGMGTSKPRVRGVRRRLR